MASISRQLQDGHWHFVATDEDAVDDRVTALDDRIVALEDAPPPEVDVSGDIEADGAIHATGNITADGALVGEAVSADTAVLNSNLFLWASIAPADEEIAAGQVAVHYDQYTGKLYLRGRLSNGDLFSKTLAVEP